MKKMILKQISVLLFSFLFIIGMTSVVFPSTSDQEIVFYSKLQGTINKSLANDFENVLGEAENSHTDVLSIETDIEKRPISLSEKDSKPTSESNRFLNPTLIWFLAGLILIILEFMVPGVILIFFGVGAWIVSLTSFLKVTTSLESQLLGFVIASILLLVFLRRWIRGKFHGHVSDVQDLTENLDEFTGKRVLVLQTISPGNLGGQVEFKGSTWKAISEEHIKEGEFATITGVDGITLRVGTVEEEE